ncbi:MAG: GNAT family N-acetyltransferase [Gammaproteobacteria bacterium]|nr:MAG: GNAT family N-acetyltransferase [Gammaproteobacteria bacterium]
MDIQPVTLTGQYVYLEPVADKHIAGLFAIGQNADDWCYMPRPCFQSIEDTAGWVNEFKHAADTGQGLCFVIRSLTTKQVLGSSSYLNVRHKDRGLEIGYTWMAKKAQRTAANTEAKLLLLTHAFESLNAIRVEFKTDARNQRSQKAISRIGAQKEGVFRNHMIVQNGYVRDSVYFSIVAEEWLAVKSKLKAML